MFLAEKYVPQSPSIGQLLDEQRDALDALCADVDAGICGADHFDDCEQRASDIGMGLRDAFRKGAR